MPPPNTRRFEARLALPATFVLLVAAAAQAAAGTTVPPPRWPRALADAEIRIGSQIREADGRTRTLPVLVRVRAPVAATRRPLDLALVIDTSASMAGELDGIRRAAVDLIGRLGDKDRLTLIACGTGTHTMFGPALVSGTRTISYELGRIRAAGDRPLSDCVEQALATIAPQAERAARARILVLGDGRTIRDSSAAGRWLDAARRVRERGVSLTVIAPGDTPRAAELSVAAAAGGGAYHHGAALRLAGVLALEFPELHQAALEQIEVGLRLGPNVRLGTAHGLPVRVTGDGLAILAGSLPPGGSRSVVLELKIACSDSAPGSVGRIDLNYVNRARDGLALALYRDLGTACAKRTTEGDVGVDLLARLTRAASAVSFVLDTWDPQSMDDVQRFVEVERTLVREQVERGGDPLLIDLLSYIDRATSEVRLGISALVRQWESERANLRTGEAGRLHVLQQQAAYRMIRKE